MSKDMAPVTPGLVTAVLGSALMASATVMVVVFHAIMFDLSSRSDHGAAASYLWTGTIEAALTCSASVVLYRLPWRGLTPTRSAVVVLGAVAAVSAVALWISFWSAR